MSDIVLAINPQQAGRRETTSIMCHARRTCIGCQSAYARSPILDAFPKGFTVNSESDL